MMVVSIMISACRKTLKGYIFSEYGNKTLKLVKDVLVILTKEVVN
jgi:hypothetical protein